MRSVRSPILVRIRWKINTPAYGKIISRYDPVMVTLKSAFVSERRNIAPYLQHSLNMHVVVNRAVRRYKTPVKVYFCVRKRVFEVQLGFTRVF